MTNAAITPVEAGKSTLSRYADLVTNMAADLGGVKARLDLLERSDRTFKLLAVSLLVLLVGAASFCGVEFHRLNETISHLGR